MEPHDTINRIRNQELYSTADVARLRSLTKYYPNDARLWDVLGDITQLVDAPITDRTESLECYKRSIACDPLYAPAHESLGYWYDIEAQYELAAQHFRLAIDSGGGDTALIGFARVLEQLGRSDEARSAMDQCRDQSNPTLLELRAEIADGYWTPDAE